MKNKLFDQEFNRSVFKLTIASLLAQTIIIFSTPLLTRIYTPEDFGVLSLYISVSGVALALATCRLEMAIMLPSNNYEADNIVSICLLISTCVTSVLLFCVFVFSIFEESIFGSGLFKSWMYWLPITTFFGGAVQAISIWLNRAKEYQLLAASKLIQSGSVSFISIVLGFYFYLSGGLIVGFVAGAVLTSMYLIYKAGKSGLSFSYPFKVRLYCQKYKNLLFYSLPGSLLDNFRLVIINILIGFYFGNDKIGFYTLALKFIQLPSVLIGSSLSQVLFEEISTRKRNNQAIYTHVKSYVKRTFILALLIYIPVYILSEWGFAFVFGSNWKEAGDVAKILIPWVFLSFISSPLSMIYITMNMQKSLLFLSFLYFSFPVVVVIIFNKSGYFYVLNWVSFGMGVIAILMILVLLCTIKQYDTKIDNSEVAHEI